MNVQVASRSEVRREEVLVAATIGEEGKEAGDCAGQGGEECDSVCDEEIRHGVYIRDRPSVYLDRHVICFGQLSPRICYQRISKNVRGHVLDLHVVIVTNKTQSHVLEELF